MILLLVLSLKCGLIKVAKLGGSGASVNCCSKDGCNWNASTAQVMMNLIFKSQPFAKAVAILNILALDISIQVLIKSQHISASSSPGPYP